MKGVFLNIITGIVMIALASMTLGGIAYVSLQSGDGLGVVISVAAAFIWCAACTYGVFVLSGIAENPLHRIHK